MKSCDQMMMIQNGLEKEDLEQRSRKEYEIQNVHKEGKEDVEDIDMELTKAVTKTATKFAILASIGSFLKGFMHGIYEYGKMRNKYGQRF